MLKLCHAAARVGEGDREGVVSRHCGGPHDPDPGMLKVSRHDAHPLGSLPVHGPVAIRMPWRGNADLDPVRITDPRGAGQARLEHRHRCGPEDEALADHSRDVVKGLCDGAEGPGAQSLGVHGVRERCLRRLSGRRDGGPPPCAQLLQAEQPAGARRVDQVPEDLRRLERQPVPQGLGRHDIHPCQLPDGADPGGGCERQREPSAVDAHRRGLHPEVAASRACSGSRHLKAESAETATAAEGTVAPVRTRAPALEDDRAGHSRVQPPADRHGLTLDREPWPGRERADDDCRGGPTRDPDRGRSRGLTRADPSEK